MLHCQPVQSPLNLLMRTRKRCNHRSRRCEIVYAFYDPQFSFGDLVKRGEHLRGALTDCLIGNVDDQDFKELFESMSDLARCLTR